MLNTIKNICAILLFPFCALIVVFILAKDFAEHLKEYNKQQREYGKYYKTGKIEDIRPQ